MAVKPVMSAKSTVERRRSVSLVRSTVSRSRSVLTAPAVNAASDVLAKGGIQPMSEEEEAAQRAEFEAAVEQAGDTGGAVRIAGQQHERRVVADLGA